VTDVELEQLFADAGADGWLHAVDLATGAEVAHRADEAVVAASVFKLPILLTVLQQAELGRVDLTRQVPVGADRPAGTTGISALLDPVTMSVRDLAAQMIVVSDNAASDAVFDLVGRDGVRAALDALGLPATKVPFSCADLFEQIDGQLAEGLGFDELGVLDPAATNTTTAREATSLLSRLWLGEVVGPELTALAQRILLLQVWPHRLSSGFAEDGWHVGGKTGSLLNWRNEVGVVTHDDGGAWAVAVFTRAHSITEHAPACDAAIGRAARRAVDLLREGA